MAGRRFDESWCPPRQASLGESRRYCDAHDEWTWSWALKNDECRFWNHIFREGRYWAKVCSRARFQMHSEYGLPVCKREGWRKDMKRTERTLLRPLEHGLGCCVPCIHQFSITNKWGHFRRSASELVLYASFSGSSNSVCIWIGRLWEKIVESRRIAARMIGATVGKLVAIWYAIVGIRWSAVSRFSIVLEKKKFARRYDFELDMSAKVFAMAVSPDPIGSK